MSIRHRKNHMAPCESKSQPPPPPPPKPLESHDTSPIPTKKLPGLARARARAEAEAARQLRQESKTTGLIKGKMQVRYKQSPVREVCGAYRVGVSTLWMWRTSLIADYRSQRRWRHFWLCDKGHPFLHTGTPMLLFDFRGSGGQVGPPHLTSE